MLSALSRLYQMPEAMPLIDEYIVRFEGLAAEIRLSEFDNLLAVASALNRRPLST
jgi:hypothetical protein